MRIRDVRDRWFPNVLCSLLFLTGLPAWASAADASNESLRDAKDYLEAIQKAKELSIDDQIELWRRFLDDHPQTSFRDEIEANKKHLDEFLLETDPVRKRERMDSDRYLRAVEFSKKLSPEDQVDLWEQYLGENPGTLYRKEILQRLEGLQAKQKKRKPGEPPTVPKQSLPVTSSPIAPRLPYKDSQTAVLLATFPGLVVPGIAHWYTRDYALAGILTGVRAGGLAVGIPGIVQGNSTMIVAGAIIAGFTYLLDIIDAPFTVQRYNEDLETGSKAKAEVFPFGVAVSFNF
jgi:hypothetical protein